MAAPSASDLLTSDRKYNVAMVCDFFYPRLGGVEMHIWSLSQCLLKMGHKVIVVTNLYPSSAGERVGVRHMTNGLKVYYMPIVAMVDQATMPTYYGWFPLFRDILLRERIEIVHGHAATSPLMHECLIQAKTMGLKTVFTDHSLFGFADAASINVNKYLKFTLSNVDHCICVSHTDRENLVLRAHLDPTNVSTIPNAVDASKFTPEISNRPPWPGSTAGSGASVSAQAALGAPPSAAVASHGSRATASLLQGSTAAASGATLPTCNPSLPPRINIVLLSRLVYRKGIDLVINVIPAICARYPNVYFIIGGDGPKRLLLEEMRERHSLHDRVELLGAVAHKDVRSVLSRGHIFLNCSLTEAFCIAILEAACCGCFVVSTRVGGVPEVLPSRMTRFADPRSEDLIAALEEAIPLAQHVDPWDFHVELRDCYNWPEVAMRTCKVYDAVTALPAIPLLERLRRYFGVGRVFGPIACILITCIYLMWLALEAVRPREDIDIVPDLPLQRMRVVTAGEEQGLREAAAAGASVNKTPLSATAAAARRAKRPIIVTPSELKRGYAALARPGAGGGGAAGASGVASTVPVQQLLLAHRPAAGTLSLTVSTLRSPCSRGGEGGSASASGAGAAQPAGTAAGAGGASGAAGAGGASGAAGAGGASGAAAAGGSARVRTPSPPPFRPPPRSSSASSLGAAAGPATPGLASPVRSRHGSSASGDTLVGAGIAMGAAAAASSGSSASPSVPPRPQSSSSGAALAGNSTDSRRGSITSPFRPVGPSHMRRRGSSALSSALGGTAAGGVGESLNSSPVVDEPGSSRSAGGGVGGGEGGASGAAAAAAAIAAAAGLTGTGRPRSTPAGAAGLLSPRPVLPPAPEALLETDGVPSTPVAGASEGETPSIFDRLSSVDRFRLGFAGPSSLSLASLVPAGSMLALAAEGGSSTSTNSGSRRGATGRGGLRRDVSLHGMDPDASTNSLTQLAASSSTGDFDLCLSPSSVVGGSGAASGVDGGGAEDVGFSLGGTTLDRGRAGVRVGGAGGPVLGSFDGSIFTDESDDGLTAPPTPAPASPAAPF